MVENINVQKNKFNEMESRATSYNNLKKSVSQKPASFTNTESMMIEGSSSIVDGKASSLSRSQIQHPILTLKPTLENKEKLSMDEIRRILLNIHRSGSGAGTPISSHAPRNNDLAFFGENENEW